VEVLLLKLIKLKEEAWEIYYLPQFNNNQLLEVWILWEALETFSEEEPQLNNNHRLTFSVEMQEVA
jgi:hypothetical protein